VRICLALAIAAAALLSGCPSGSSCGPSSATVTEVVDGDTVVLEGGQRVRYILVDTPEITLGHNDCYGAEARDYNKSLVLDQKVDLTYDQQCTDRYGRLLAYVSVQGHDVNALLVERGFGCVLYIPPDGDGRVDEFRALQSQAKTDGRGLWGSCTTGACF
jgi:micrococcal nuclease